MKVLKNLKFISIILVLAMLFTSLSPAVVYAEDEEQSLLSLEGLIALMFRGVANGINILLSLVLGRMITIDDFVFNNYPDTKIDFFMSSPPGPTGVGKENGMTSALIWGVNGDGTGGLAEAINEWYSIFRKIAVIVYMVMIVYMGVKIMLSSTGEGVAQYKTLFMHWVTGITILFFYPYVIKYAIKINDTLVETVETSKNTILTGVAIEPPAVLLPDTTTDLSLIDFDNSPYASGGGDYMSVISEEANRSNRLAPALLYIILTWQLLALAVHYYKRIWMVGFLIVIFPIVMTFYVLDKIGDGKSQSFSKWNKEFIVNVFIQSFHAVVYIFVVGTVCAARAPDGTYDYVLVLTGSTFLFIGEEIVKKIFSQESPSMRSLGATAAKTMAGIAVVKGATKVIAAPIGKATGAVVRYKSASAKAKELGLKLSAADKLKLFRTTTAPNAGLRLKGAQAELERIDADNSLSDAEKASQKAEVIRVANAVAAVNNPNTRSAQELADAYRILQEARGTDIGDAVMDGSNMKLSKEQLADMADLESEVAIMAGQGADCVQIDRHLQARMGYILPTASEEEQKKYKRMLLADMYQRGASRYPNPKQSAHDEVEDTIRELNALGDSFVFGDTKGNKKDRNDYRDKTTELAQEFFGNGRYPTKQEKALVRSVLILKHRDAGIYSQEEYLEHLEKIRKAEGAEGIDQEAAQRLIATLDVDPAILEQALAARLARKTRDPSCKEYNDYELKKKVEDILANYSENGERAGYYDDEVSPEELLEVMAIPKESERNAKIREIEEKIGNARIATNEVERELVSDIAADLLAIESQEEVNIAMSEDPNLSLEEAIKQNNVLTKGGIDTTTEYFDGHTREEYEKAIRKAKQEKWKALIGLDSGKKNPIDQYSDDYIENQKIIRDHYYGDNPNV